MSQEKKRAIIIGGSIAGLLSAAVLSSFFEEILIIERDCFESYGKLRKGVPQSAQPHILLTKGYRILQEFFPGIQNDLLAAGAIPIDWGRDFRFYSFGGWNATHHMETDLQSFSCTRPLIEQIIRCRVTAIQNVKVLSSYKVKSLVGNASIVTGVKCDDKHSNGLILSADLIIDASGRSSNARKWLSKIKSEEPITDSVDAKLGYATQRYKVPEDWKQPWTMMVISHEPPLRKRLGNIARIEGNEIIATLGGYCQDYPPTSQEKFVEYAKTLSAPDFYEIIRMLEPSSDIKAYRATANKLVRYDKLVTMPKGFIALGDSVCSLCPAYGQGLTVSAISALTLKHWIEYTTALSIELNSLDFQRRLTKRIEPAWMVATNFDSGFNDVVGGRTNNFLDVIAIQYVRKLAVKAQTNSLLGLRLTRITHMLDPLYNFVHPKNFMALIRDN